MKLSELEKDMCAQISKYYPIPLKEIIKAYQKLKSFDDLICTLDMASNPDTKVSAILNLLKSSIEKTKKKVTNGEM